MKLILFTVIVCIVSVLEAKSTYRQYGPGGPPPDEATMACAMALHQIRLTCGEQPFENVIDAGSTPRQIYNKVLQTSLQELCSPVQRFYQCVSNKLTACVGVNHPMATQTLQVFNIVGVAVKFVCEQKVATIERHKACLLREAGGQSQSIHSVPQITLGFSIASSCVHPSSMNPSQPFCIPRQSTTCAKQLIANQCGSEIASTLEELAEQIRAAADCPSAVVRSLTNSIRNADYSAYKRLLDTLSFF